MFSAFVDSILILSIWKGNVEYFLSVFGISYFYMNRITLLGFL